MAATSPPRASAAVDSSVVRRMVLANVGLLTGVLILQVLLTNHSGHSSISDLPHLVGMRHIGPHALPYLDRPFEYPVGAGMVFWAAVSLAPSPAGVLVVTGVLTIVASVGVTVLLARHCGGVAWRWAVGLPVALYAFQNWDVLAVLSLVGAIVAFERGRDGVAGGLLGLGTLVKLFPIVVAPPLIAYRWAQGDRRGARRLGITAIAVVLLGNLPFAIGNVSGWWWQVSFQGGRVATWGSMSMYVYKVLGLPAHGPAAAHVANLVSMVAIAAGLITITALVSRGRLDPRRAVLAAVAVFVLANKVYSPTYDLWFVALFVLVPVRRRWWVAFCAVDATVFFLVYGYFHGIVDHATIALVLPAVVVARAAVIAVILVPEKRANLPMRARRRGLRLST